MSDIIDLTGDGVVLLKREPGANREVVQKIDADDDVVEEWTCAICIDLILGCTTLECGHSFCLGCIHHYWAIGAGNGAGKVCPTCRAVHTDSKLQRSFAADATIEKLAKRSLSAAELEARTNRRQAMEAAVPIPAAPVIPMVPVAVEVEVAAVILPMFPVGHAVPLPIVAVNLPYRRPYIARHSRADTTTIHAQTIHGRKCRKCHSYINHGQLRIVKRFRYIGDEHYHIGCMASRRRNLLKLADICDKGQLSAADRNLLAQAFA